MYQAYNVLSCLFRGEDLMTVLQTGYQKSLIFQLFVIFLIGVQRLEPTLQALMLFPYCKE